MDKHEDSFDERLNRETRPPDGQRLVLHSLRFAEVIELEDYDRLEEGLNRLYDETLNYNNVLASPSEQEGYREFIANSKRAFLSRRWANLQGFVSKSFADVHRDGIILKPVRELPEGVTSLSFLLCQVLPSMVVVVTRVSYDESISDRLNTIFMEYCKERIEKHEQRTLHIPLDRVKAEKIQEFLSNLQTTSELFISTYFKGAFLSARREGVRYKCPSIKLYSLQDIPFQPISSLTNWIVNRRHFIDVLGYGAVPSWMYQFDNNYLLLRRYSFEREEKPMTLSLLTSESLFAADEAHEGYRAAAGAIEHKHEIEFDNLLPLVAFHHLLHLYSQGLLDYRNKLHSYCINPDARLNTLRKQYSAIYNAKVAINNDYFDFIKLSRELEEVTSAEAETLLYRDTTKFEMLENPKRIHFAKETVSAIRFLSSMINKTYSLLNERYSDL